MRDALPFLVHLQTNLQGGDYQDPPFMWEETDDAKQPEGRKLAPGWNFTPWKQAGNCYWNKIQRQPLGSHLRRQSEEQSRPGKLWTVFHIGTALGEVETFSSSAAPITL